MPVRGAEAGCSGDGGVPLVAQQQNSGNPMVWFNSGCIAPSPRTGLSGPDLQSVCAAYPGCK